jgi:hypothetical protein
MIRKLLKRKMPGGVSASVKTRDLGGKVYDAQAQCFWLQDLDCSPNQKVSARSHLCSSKYSAGTRSFNQG